MSFQPVIPSSGLSGWMFLDRTYDTQLDSFGGSTEVQRDIAYFREAIGSVSGAADLVEDRRLRKVALGAFGLTDDMPNRYFVQKILEDGTTDRSALANKLADARYRKFSASFGLGPGEVRQTLDSAAMEKIADLYLFHQFEEAVGAQDETMRIALYARRELPILAGTDQGEDTKWFTILGEPPLRQLFETALGLPPSFGQADIDKQVEVFRDRMQSALGISKISDLSDGDLVEKMIITYQARAQIDGFSANTSSAATALVLLQGA